jgi:thymidylate synthase
MKYVNDTTPAAHGRLIEHLSTLDEGGSRIGGQREELGVLVHSDDTRDRYLVRDDTWNLAFQLQEHWAYWAGANPGHVQRYNTNMETWMVDGELPGSAYGDRLRNTVGHDQIGRALRQLRESPDTRRAMMVVHQPGAEDYSGGDVACTAYLHPILRGGELHMIATIRSQDMHWGYPYDAANNQFIQEAMAAELGVEPGEYWHLMDSCHYYTDMEDDVLGTLQTSTTMCGPELDLPDGRPWGHEFDVLTHGLERSRAGDDGGVERAQNMLETEFCEAWLLTMHAYECARFRENAEWAMTYADRVPGEWGVWIREYVGGKLDDR